jgi:hypothetical protein
MTTLLFMAFPVYKNVLGADSGSCSNPRVACCAAAYALVVLICRSFVKTSKEREKTFFGSLALEAEAAGHD